MRQAIPFGKYLLLDRISVGGMAEVFKAKSYGVEGFEKVIAIKRILPSMGEDRDFIKMFIDEAKIAGQLAHANICQIFELGRTEGAHFIAMEFIWGKDLLQIQNRLRKLKQTMSVPMGCYIVAKVCEGLDYAHRRRDPMGRPLEIVHRDCSPQNVLISYEGEVKLIDFGIAKAASRSSRTMHGVLKGKFGYMSPEQVRGLPLDRRSDIFALGTILYESLTGERLFQGDTDFAILEKVRNVEIVPPRKINPSIPVEVERIILKALARDVDVRYQWCSELLADLQAFLMSQPQVFTAKGLAQWIKEGFAAELEKERLQLESYKKVGREGLIAGVPQAEARLDVVEHLGHAGQAEDPTVLGGPSFDDMAGEGGATQISSLEQMAEMAAVAGQVSPGNAVPAVAGEMRARPREEQDGFPDDGPTTIFGEDGQAPLLPPTPQSHFPPPSAPSVAGRSTASVPVVPPPPRAPKPAPGMPPHMGGAAPPPSPPPTSNRTLFGMGAPVIHPPPQQQLQPPPQQFPAGSYPPPAPQYHGGAAPSDADTQAATMNVNQLPVAQLVAQAQAQLAAYHQQQHAQHGPPPAQPYGQQYAPPPAPAHNADARTVMGMQAPPLPLQPGPPSGAMAASAPVGYDYSQGGHVQPSWPDMSQPLGAMPSFTPSGIVVSPPTNPNAVVAASAQPEKRRRSSLGKDIAIGVAIAALVLGVVAVIKFAVLGDEGGAKPAAAAAGGSGSIVIAASNAEGAEVYVGDQKKGVISGGALTLEGVALGEVEVRVERPGTVPCKSTLKIEADKGAMMSCSFTVAAVAPATPDAGVPAVVADAAPMAAAVDAAPVAPVAPIDAAPAVAVIEGNGSGSGSGSGSVAPIEKKDEKKDEPKDEKREEKKHRGSGSASGSTKASGSGSGSGSAKKKGSGSGSGSGSSKSKPPAATGDGYLVAYTTPWAKVLLDGKDTGKMTPIAPRAKIGLTPGKHKVTFVVGRESWSYNVTITAGETTKLTKDLPVSAN